MRKIIFALLMLPFVFPNEGYGQNFTVAPLINIAGDNLEFDVINPDILAPDSTVYICWVNKLDSVYTVYLKQISPLLGNNIIVSSDSQIKSRPRVSFIWYNQNIKIAWQCKVNTKWRVYSKNYSSNKLSDSVLVLDSLETDPQISLSNFRIAWIENGNLFIKEFYPNLSGKIIFDSLNCSSPDLYRHDYPQETAVLYEKDFIDSVKVYLTLYQRDENPPPRFERICLSNGIVNKNPKFGLNWDIAFQTFEDGIWKSEYTEYYYWPFKITQNTECNYYNPIIFTYPIPSSSLHNYTPFFLAFDTDSTPNNREIFIKTFFYYGQVDSLINISQSQGNDYNPKLTIISEIDSNCVAIIWTHNEANKTDIWIAKTKFNRVMFIADDKLENYSFQLWQNYPNPFNPSTKISWQSPVSGWQTLKVYDVLGNEVATLVNEEKPLGTYEVTWNATNLPSGVYFYRIQSGNFIDTKKMIILK
jgi:hypothetical protein